jgi:hypothetical protein
LIVKASTYDVRSADNIVSHKSITGERVGMTDKERSHKTGDPFVRYGIGP